MNMAIISVPQFPAGLLRLAFHKFKICGTLALALMLWAAPVLSKKSDDNLDGMVFGANFDNKKFLLHLLEDDFFALILNNGKIRTEITGNWQLSPDGVELMLTNRQDLELRISKVKKRLYTNLASLGLGEIKLEPVTASSEISIVGSLEKKMAENRLVDAASGKIFVVPANLVSSLPDDRPLFITARVIINGRNAYVDRITDYSRNFPRFLGFINDKAKDMGGGMACQSSAQVFKSSVAERYWLLPTMPGLKKAAIFFEQPSMIKKSERSSIQEEGAFSISGPGLRCEGKYLLHDGKLTIDAANGSVKNIKAIGAEALLSFFNEYDWALRGQYLELADGKGRRILLQ